MKCICGYEKQDNSDESQEQFKMITFSEDSDGPLFIDPFVSQPGIYNDIRVTIYACPKCGTLKINLPI